MSTPHPRVAIAASIIAALLLLHGAAAPSAASGLTRAAQAERNGTGPAGAIELVASLAPAGDPGRFDLLLDGVAVATGVGDAGSSGPIAVAAGAHAVAETGAGGTSLASYASTLTCRADGKPMPGLSGITATSASVEVADGQTIVCAFANARRTPSVLPPTPAVLPPASVRGIARLRGPEGCVRPGVVRTRIAGLNIHIVSFYRDGRLVRRVHDGTVSRTAFVLRTRVRPGDFALHTVRVRVRFISGARPRVKTLLHRFAQCRIAGVTG